MNNKGRKPIGIILNDFDDERIVEELNKRFNHYSNEEEDENNYVCFIYKGVW